MRTATDATRGCPHEAPAHLNSSLTPDTPISRVTLYGSGQSRLLSASGSGLSEKRG